MRNKLFIGVFALSALMVLNAKQKDPVLMSVNGNDVNLSEFEYLYNKNKQQQLEKQSLDKYLEMFTIYKLKVADAKAAGVDTTKSFITEFDHYRDDLAAPYLEDKTVEDKLAREAYERMKEDVEVSHIMYYLEDQDTKSRTKPKEFLDSLKKCILAGQDFGELAAKYSIDRTAKENKGNIGFIGAGKLPYSFEYAAYNTPVGSLSDIVETRFGYHLIKPLSRRPSQGQVLVEHIMKLIPKDASKDEANKKKAQMDSIYQLLKKGANFEELAIKESDDPGSAKKGGLLPWFGAGEMVSEFEKKSFAMAKDSICPPFATAYGYHIIKKLDSRGLDSYENLKDKIKRTFVDDERAFAARTAKLEQLKKQYKLTKNQKNVDMLLDALTKNGGFDSTFVANFSNSNVVLFSFADKKVPVKDLIKQIKGYGKLNVIAGKGLVNRNIDAMMDNSIVEYEKGQLELKYPDYCNLVHEYRDGLLLFDISNRKIWDGASNDVKGLANYFDANKAKYTWDKPKFKGFLIQVANDSVAREIEKSIKTLDSDTLIRTLRREFKKDIRIEKVLVAEGENAMVDQIVFGVKDAPVKKDAKFPIFFVERGKLITTPEDYADVRGPVTADYQTELETKWIKELKEKYPVRINKKVLSEIK